MCLFRFSVVYLYFLQMLDVSYNNLSPEDILPLGLIPNLKILHLTGNSLRTLPGDMARPHLDEQR